MYEIIGKRETENAITRHFYLLLYYLLLYS